MRQSLRQALGVFLALQLAASSSQASWMYVPLARLVEQNPVVVAGRIVGIKTTDAPKDGRSRRLDIASLVVDRILKNEIDGLEIKVGGAIPLAMPSRKSARRTGNDIFYERGRDGVWILEYDGEYFRATYPGDFQKRRMEERIHALIVRQATERAEALDRTIREHRRRSSHLARVPVYGAQEFDADLGKKIPGHIDPDTLTPIYVYRRGETHGWVYVDGSGTVHLATKYHGGHRFWHGLARVGTRLGRGNVIKSYGYMDRTGRLVQPVYDSHGPFSDGLAAVSKDGKFGYIDTKGRTVVPLKYDLAYGFSDGAALVRQGDTKYLIDRQGKVVFEASRRDAPWPLSEGLLFVNVDAGSIPSARPGLKPWHGRWVGFVDSTGRFVIDASENNIGKGTFCRTGIFRGGHVRVERRTKKGYLYGFLSRSGQLTVPPQYRGAGDFSEGLAAVTLDDRRDDPLWGYIDETGTLVIKPSFLGAGLFSEGLAPVKVLSWVAVPRRTVASTGKEDEREQSSALTVVRKEKYGYVDRTGRMVITAWFDRAGEFSNGLARVNEGDAYGFIDRAGKYAWRTSRLVRTPRR